MLNSYWYAGFSNVLFWRYLFSAPQVEIQSTKIYKNKNSPPRNNKYFIENTNSNGNRAENITIAYLSNTLRDESISQKRKKFRK